MYRKEDDPDSSRWYFWYIYHPIAGLGTLLLKVFNVLDVDLLFPYGEARNPWYRWPICVFNQLLLCFGFVGTLWSARAEATREVRFAAFVVTVYFFCFMGVHSVAAVESRYGLPMLAIALAICSVRRIILAPRSGGRTAALDVVFDPLPGRRVGAIELGALPTRISNVDDLATYSISTLRVVANGRLLALPRNVPLWPNWTTAVC